MRGSDNVAMTWELQHKSLSAFIRTVLGYFYCFLKLCDREWLLNFFAYIPNSSSAINHAYWRSQRIVVRSLAYTEPPLSTTNIPTGLSNFPFCGAPSPFIPTWRHTSQGFNHTKMLYALGGPDGTGKSTFLLAFGGFLAYSTILFFLQKKNITNHGLPSSLNLQLQVIPITIIACSYKHSIWFFY